MNKRLSIDSAQALSKYDEQAIINTVKKVRESSVDMESVDIKLLASILSLERGETYEITHPAELLKASSNLIILASEKRMALRNLFKIFLTRDQVEQETLAMDEFVEHYERTELLYRSIIDATAIAIIGVDTFKLLSATDSVHIGFRSSTNTLTIENSLARGCGC